MMTRTTAAAAGLQKVLDAWFDAWNANDLDRVMTFFAENAVYRPGDGSEHRGKAAVRRAFEPQFRGARRIVRPLRAGAPSSWLEAEPELRGGRARSPLPSLLRQERPDDGARPRARVDPQLRAVLLREADRDLHGRAVEVLAEGHHGPAALTRLPVALAEPAARRGPIASPGVTLVSALSDARCAYGGTRHRRRMALRANAVTVTERA